MASALRAIALSTYGKPLFRNLWRSLYKLGISRTKPIRCECCAGQRKKILSHIVQEGLNPQANSFLYQLLDLEKKICGDLHFGNQSSEVNVLNSQIDIYIQPTPRTHYVLKVKLANVMSLVPKLDKVQEFIHRNQICLAFITETWLKESISESVVNIHGFTILCKDRVTNNCGGVCVYIKNDNIKYRVLEELSCCQDHKILWLQLKPTHLPRGVSCLIAAVVYHPPGADDNSICDHLLHSLTLVESKFLNYGIIVAGDFNCLDVTLIKKHFRLKQIKSPTCKDVILDLVLTNLKDYYDTSQSLPPFGLSDYNTTMVSPREVC